MLADIQKLVFESYMLILDTHGLLLYQTKKDTVLNAFKSVIDKLEEKPLNVISDLGLEFKNAAFEKYCKDNNIKHHFPYTFMHAAIIERFHR